VLVLGDEERVLVRWKNVSTVEIQFPSYAKTFLKNSNVEEVHVRFYSR